MCRLAELERNEEELLFGLCCEDKNVDQVIGFLSHHMTPYQYKRNIKILKSRLVSWCSSNADFFTPPEWEKISRHLTQTKPKDSLKPT